MKKTLREYNEMISNFFGIKEGDTIKFKKDILGSPIAKITTDVNGGLVLRLEDVFLSPIVSLTHLLDKEYEIIQSPTKLGGMKCGFKRCEECPLRTLDCLINRFGNVTLYEMLDEVCECKRISKESNIYKAFKEMLDNDCENYKG